MFFQKAPGQKNRIAKSAERRNKSHNKVFSGFQEDGWYNSAKYFNRNPSECPSSGFLERYNPENNGHNPLFFRKKTHFLFPERDF